MTLDELELCGKIWKDVQEMYRWRGKKLKEQRLQGPKAHFGKQWVAMLASVKGYSGGMLRGQLRVPTRGWPWSSCSARGRSMTFVIWAHPLPLRGVINKRNLAAWGLDCVWGSPGGRHAYKVRLKSFTNRPPPASWRWVYWPICWKIPDLWGCFSRSGEVMSIWVINLVGSVTFSLRLIHFL